MDTLFESAKSCLKEGLPQAKTLSVVRQIRKRGLTDNFVSLKVAILATANVDFLTPALEVTAFSQRIHLSTLTAGFNQIDQEVLNPGSELYAFKPRLAILYVRPEDIVSKLTYSTADVDLNQIDEWITHIRTKLLSWTENLTTTGIKVVLFSFVRPSFPPLGIGDFVNSKGQTAIWRKLNEILIDIAAINAGITIIDLEGLVRRIGLSNWVDPKLWSLAKIPGGTKFAAEFAMTIMPVINEATGRRKKCLVLDLDNTLWGGIIGEDGVSGVKLGGDYPGNCYLEFQKSVLNLWKQGVILAINSKNNFGDAAQMFETNPDMQLRLDHFTVHKINWTDKAENLNSIAAELNIGLDSLVFVDDNPVECERVSTVHPEVMVFQVPARIEQFSEQFSRVARFFDGAIMSEEDRQRNQMYKQNQLRKEEQRKVQNIGDFLSSLEMIAEVDVLNKGNIQRVVQLIQKTNQFNVTTRRHSEQFISNLINDNNWLTYIVRLKDKYGDNGIVLVILVNVTNGQAIIDTFLMSCRVIGRTLERTVMKLLLKDLAKRGVKSLTSEFIPTAKNKLVENLFPDLGFKLLEEVNGTCTYETSTTILNEDDPSYIKTNTLSN
jgi:FkbH-like protein